MILILSKFGPKLIFFVAASLFLAASAFGFTADAARELSYRIQRIEGDTARYRITLTFRGEAGGTTDIELPNEWGGQRELYKAIRELRVTSPGASINVTNDPHRKTITHPPGSEISIEYYLTQDFTGPFRNEVRYRPVVDEQYIHWIGHTVWVRPAIKEDELLDVRFDWRGFPPQWRFANSYGLNPGVQKRRLSLDDLGRSVIVAGDFRITTVKAGKEPVHVAIRGEWEFKDKELAGMAGRVISSQREFWNDHSQKYFLVTLVPIDEGPNSYSFGGTGLLDSFALFATSNAQVPLLRGLLAHEYFHNWNPVRLGKMPDPEQSMYWLSEGFTEFYTYELLHRSRIISDEELIEEFNRRIKEYYTLPTRTEPNSRIVSDFWNDREIGRLPYLRGMIFAMNLNAAIKKATGGRNSLDDLIRDLNGQYKRSKPLLTSELIVAGAAKYLGHNAEAFAARLQKEIYDGELIAPDTAALDGLARLETAEIPLWEIGLDTDVLLKKRLVAGVRPDTAAFAAGLRNGQKVIGGVSIYLGDISKEVALKVADDNGEREVEIFARRAEQGRRAAVRPGC
jgi:predicted metalloprotease with PDZ domain